MFGKYECKVVCFWHDCLVKVGQTVIADNEEMKDNPCFVKLEDVKEEEVKKVKTEKVKVKKSSSKAEINKTALSDEFYGAEGKIPEKDSDKVEN